MKTCFKCNQEKPLQDFYKHPRMSDGHLNKCKECAKRDVSANYFAHRPYYAVFYVQREQRLERKEARRRYNKNRNRLHKRAAYLAGNAVRDKRLIRQPCEVCGGAHVEAHHDDYSKPLDVRWLCHRHHLEHHGKTPYEI